MISRRKLFGLIAGAVVAPVVAVLPKPSLADEVITLLGKNFPEEFKYIPEAQSWIDVRHPYAALADTLRTVGSSGHIDDRFA